MEIQKDIRSVALVSPLHDPNARLLGMIKEYGTELVQLYEGKIGVSVTDITSPQTIDALNQADIEFSVCKGRQATKVGANYRKAIKFGLGFNTSHIHLTDLDRALHWVKRFPKEIEEVKSKMVGYPGFLVFIRSTRAFETHPYEQRSTEAVINSIASRVAGLNVDIMSGSFGMDSQTADAIASNTKRNDYGFCAEYLEIALKQSLPLHTIEVEGLEWETPDQFQDKIIQEGYSTWLSEFESLSEWKKRVALIEDSSEELLRSTS